MTIADDDRFVEHSSLGYIQNNFIVCKGPNSD